MTRNIECRIKKCDFIQKKSHLIVRKTNSTKLWFPRNFSPRIISSYNEQFMQFVFYVSLAVSQGCIKTNILQSTNTLELYMNLLKQIHVKQKNEPRWKALANTVTNFPLPRRIIYQARRLNDTQRPHIAFSRTIHRRIFALSTDNAGRTRWCGIYRKDQSVGRGTRFHRWMKKTKVRWTAEDDCQGCIQWMWIGGWMVWVIGQFVTIMKYR